MSLYLGCMLYFNMRGQHALIDASSAEQYSVLAPRVMERMNEYFSTGKVVSVRKYLQELNKEISGFDILVFDPDKSISIAGDPKQEGRSLSSIVSGKGGLESAGNILSGKTSSFEYSFETKEGEKFINIFAPIKNSPECMSCHGHEKKLLGGVKISASLAEPYSLAGRSNNKLMLFGLSGLGVVLILLYLMFHRYFNRPIKFLLESTAE
jgi:hypothetical protein